jgi:flagellar motor component MotA
MTIFFIIGEILLLGLVFSAITIDQNLQWFIDWPSILIVVGGNLAMTLLSFNFNEIIDAIKHTFFSNVQKKQLEKSAYFWFCMIRNLLIVGSLGTLIGLVKILANVDNPEKIGPAMAIGVLTFFYGVLFNAMLPVPAYFLLTKKIAEIDENKEEGTL